MHTPRTKRPTNRVVNFKLDDAGWDKLEALQLAKSNKTGRVVSRSRIIRELIERAK